MRITNVARLNVEVSDPIQMQALASQNIEPVKIMKNVRDAGFLKKKGRECGIMTPSFRPCSF